MEINSEAISLATKIIKEFEGCKLIAYPDPETGGEPFTIGWGSTRLLDGSRIRRGQAITIATANALLDRTIKADWLYLSKSIWYWPKLTVGQQAALLSFTYNCGRYWYLGEGFNTISSAIKNRQLDLVPGAMILYVNPGGPSEAGLRRRRTAEAKLWTSGKL